MFAVVEPVQLRAVLWAIGLIRFAWPPFIVSVLGQWLLSVVQIAAAAFIAYALVQLGSQSEAASPLLPSSVSDFLQASGHPVSGAVVATLLLMTLSGLVSFSVAWSGSWMHKALNTKLTPAIIRAALIPQGDEPAEWDTATTIQRWLLKSELVEFMQDGAGRLVGSLGSVLLALAATFAASSTVGWICASCLAIWAVAYATIAPRSLEASRYAAARHEEVGRSVRDTVSLRNDLSRPTIVQFWLERVEGLNQLLGRSIIREGAWGSVLYGVLGTISEIIPVFCLLVAVATEGAATAITVYLFASRMVGPLGSLSQLAPVLQSNLVSAQRLYDLTNADLNRPSNKARSLAPQTVSFGDLSVQYLSTSLPLRFQDFEMRRGEALLIVGPSGSGKSSLMSCLAGIRKFTSGRLAVDGVETPFGAPEWREICCLVSQEPRLFPDDIGGNLDGFPDWVSTSYLDRLLKKLLAGIPGGRSTRVDAISGQVSGGQRRTLAVVRALGSPAQILLLDEPINGVDETIAEEIRNSLEHACAEGRMMIITTQEQDLPRLALKSASILRLNREPS